MSIGTQVNKMIFVRKADPEKEPVLDWLELNSARNEYDAAVLKYPKTEVLAAHTNGTTHVYMPVQIVAQMDSVGVNPQSSIHEVTASLIELVKAAYMLADRGGIKELLFLVNDEKIQAGAEYLGFKEVDAKVMRLKVGE